MGLDWTQVPPLAQGLEQVILVQLWAVLQEEEEVVEMQPQSLWQMELEVQQVLQEEGEEARR